MLPKNIMGKRLHTMTAFCLDKKSDFCSLPFVKGIEVVPVPKLFWLGISGILYHKRLPKMVWALVEQYRRRIVKHFMLKLVTVISHVLKFTLIAIALFGNFVIDKLQCISWVALWFKIVLLVSIKLFKNLLVRIFSKRYWDLGQE